MAALQGYTCGNDVSGRHWQRALGQWTKGKAFDTFCPIGPVIATAAAVGDPNKLGIKCRLNGKTMQVRMERGFDMCTGWSIC